MIDHPCGYSVWFLVDFFYWILVLSFIFCVGPDKSDVCIAADEKG